MASPEASTGPMSTSRTPAEASARPARHRVHTPRVQLCMRPGWHDEDTSHIVTKSSGTNGDWWIMWAVADPTLGAVTVPAEQLEAFREAALTKPVRNLLPDFASVLSSEAAYMVNRQERLFGLAAAGARSAIGVVGLATNSVPSRTLTFPILWRARTASRRFRLWVMTSVAGSTLTADVAPTVRVADGLRMSFRHQGYLSISLVYFVTEKWTETNPGAYLRPGGPVTPATIS